MKIHIGILVVTVLAMAGCHKKEVAQVPVQNAFTERVDKGVETVHRAEDVAAQLNAQTAEQNKAAADVESP